jgi:hypothetical protein
LKQSDFELRGLIARLNMFPLVFELRVRFPKLVEMFFKLFHIEMLYKATSHSLEKRRLGTKEVVKFELEPEAKVETKSSL